MMRIREIKIGFSFIIVLLVFGVFYLVNLELQSQSLKKMISIDAKDFEREFSLLEDADTKMLASVLETVVWNKDIKDIYLEGDRESLYSYTYPLFKELKEGYGITHWYFISLDGTAFLRVHNKDIYGDEITRFTFNQAKAKKEFVSGIELGKTAYALRAIVPYYNEGELIGYVELGEEIDHFLEILERKNGAEMILVGDKRYLDEKKWGDAVDIAGVKNTWDNDRSHVIISPTILRDDAPVLQCFTSDNLEDADRMIHVFQEIESYEGVSRCVGIHLTDAGGRESGVILSLLDVNSYHSFIRSSNLTIFGFLILLFALIILIIYFLLRRDK